MKIELHEATTAEIFSAFVSTDAMLGRMEKEAVERAMIREGNVPLPLMAGETLPKSHWQMVNLIVERLGKGGDGKPRFDPNVVSLYLDEIEDHHRKTPPQEISQFAT